MLDVILIVSFIILICGVLSFYNSKEESTTEDRLLSDLNSQNKFRKENLISKLVQEEQLRAEIRKELSNTIIKVRCRSCNFLNDEGSKFCIACGKKA